MTDLVEFLRARLDEDEATAKHCPRPDGWHIEDQSDGLNERDPELIGSGKSIAAFAYEHGGGLTAEHVVRHDPARVLADVEAKRRIVKLHAVEVERLFMNPVDGAGYYEDQFSCAICGWFDPGTGCATLLLLAQPYADHADYDEGWRP